MRNKGFTLIELLGVIAILAIISLIAVPAVQKAIQTGKQKAYDTQVKYIEASLEMWAADHPEELPDVEDEYIEMTLGQLKVAGYVSDDVKNPLTDQLFDDTIILRITKDSNKYTYLVEV